METGAPNRGARVAALAGPKMPADHGLPALGLLMQLGGSLFMAMFAFYAILPILLGAGAAGSETWWWFLFAASAAIRSGFHRSAGKALVFGSPGGVLRPLRVYLIVSVVQTGIAILSFNKMLAPLREWDDSFSSPTLLILAMCLAWPVTLAIITSRPRFKRFTESTLPASEDMGFEGVAVLMALLGICGTAISAFVVVMMVKAGSPFGDAIGFFSALIFLMLTIRSILHAKAGLAGVTGADPYAFHDKAQSYYNFGVVSSLLAGGGLFIAFLSQTGGRGMGPLFLMVGLIVYLLIVWPLQLKHYFTERNFGLLMAGDANVKMQRAPDAGLTALGWLLIALSVTGVAMQVSLIISEPSAVGTQRLLFAQALAGGGSGIDLWLPLIASFLQLWAGFELVGMTERYKISANVFGAFGTIATLIVHWEVLKSFDGLGSLFQLGSPGGGGGFETLMTVGMSLVLPVGTLLLVNRREIAAARALPRGQR